MGHKVVDWAVSNSVWLMLGSLALYVISRHLVIRRLKKLTAESTWSPFQSSEVRDICEHLTPGERSQLNSDAGGSGRQIAWRLAIPAGIVAVLFLFSIRAGFTLLALFVIYALLFLRPWLRENRQRVRQMLCETEYGRMKGYRPDNLRDFSFPWSRRTR